MEATSRLLDSVMPVIHLVQEDVRWAQKVALDRHAAKAAAGVPDRTFHPKGTAVANLMGVLVEMAVRIYLGDTPRSIRHNWGSWGGDGGWDGALWDSRLRYDVKASRWADASLSVRERELGRAASTAHVFILGVPPPTVKYSDPTSRTRQEFARLVFDPGDGLIHLAGWMSVREFTEKSRYGKPHKAFKRDVHWLPQEELRPMDTLRPWVIAATEIKEQVPEVLGVPPEVIAE